MSVLKRDFYMRDAVTVAKDLIGKVIVHKTSDGVVKGRIVETEAYIGMIDKASARLTLTTANVEPEALDSKEETAQPEEKDSFFREAAAGH